jgi:hypothetical protein
MVRNCNPIEPGQISFPGNDIKGNAKTGARCHLLPDFSAGFAAKLLPFPLQVSIK